MNVPMEVEFNRPAKYTRMEVLGAGACGETVRIRDEAMDAEFVAKKYCPVVSESDDANTFEELLRRFRDEARILFRLNHPNVVRVFNYFDYSEHKTSYIIMEYVEGSEILDFLKANPAAADRVFEGVVAGFGHLQLRGVLHRDIRPANILVSENGNPKIIDFGFGKQIEVDASAEEKSISLNWWCEIPPEFGEGIYDFQTEVYFVGKLFQLAVETCQLSDFKYLRLLGKMCEKDRARRTASFADIQREILRGKFSDLSFTETEISTYRAFAEELSELISSISADARLESDPQTIVSKLEELYRKTMLEETLVAPNKLAQIFVKGDFKYWTSAKVYVETMLKFLELLRGLSEEKKGIVLENLVLRLEAKERTRDSYVDDEIPF